MLISLVVPVWNEEEAVPIFYRALDILGDLQLELIFVNDGSSDSTAEVIERLIANDERLVLVNLRRNFGKEAALLAGFNYSTGDAVIPLDVDMQDPIELIPELVTIWQQKGVDMVLARRSDRSADSFLKRISSRWYYKMHNVLAREKIEENVGDFRLLSRNTVDAICSLPEHTMFMKGMMPWVGGKTAILDYARMPRVVGKTKFNGWSLWNFALDGITSFSTLPLRVWTYIGGVVAVISLLYGIWIVLSKFIWGNAVAGYSSLMTVMLFLGGVQLIGIGILGEYIGRMYTESKNRPRYIIESVLRKKNDGQ